MKDSGRLTAPGSLLKGAVLAPAGEDLGQLPDGSDSLADLAAQYGRAKLGRRP